MPSWDLDPGLGPEYLEGQGLMLPAIWWAFCMGLVWSQCLPFYSGISQHPMAGSRPLTLAQEAERGSRGKGFLSWRGWRDRNLG